MKRLGPVVVLLLALVLPASTVADAGIDDLTNAFRADNGLAAVVAGDVLTNFAYQRAIEVSIANYDPETTWNTSLHQFWWWEPSGCSTVSENLAFNDGRDSSADFAVNQWAASTTGHRENMLGDWHVMGSAIYPDEIGNVYFVQLFGRDCGAAPVPAPAPAPTTQPQPTAAPTVTLPNTAMRSPCQTSRTLSPSLNRMTATSSQCFVLMVDGTSTLGSRPSKRLH